MCSYNFITHLLGELIIYLGLQLRVRVTSNRETMECQQRCLQLLLSIESNTFNNINSQTTIERPGSKWIDDLYLL